MSHARLPGTPRLLRALNDRAALELLLSRGPLTRAQLGELTGLSKVTASQLVERLEERGLVARVGEQAGGRGPNAQMYAVVPATAYVVGVEVGPRHVMAATADITGATARGRVVAASALVWFSRAVGLAVVLCGRLHRGTNGASGEIGYLPLPGAPVPRGVSRQAEGAFPGAFQQLIGIDTVRTVAHGQGFTADTTPALVEQAVAAGDTGAPVLDEIARRLAIGVAAVALVLDPALVVLPGDLGRARGAAPAGRV